METLIEPDAPVPSTKVEKRASLWRRVKGFSLKRLFFASLGAGLGVTIIVIAVAASVVWFNSRPVPVREWPRLDIEGAGLKAKLKTDFNDSVRYQLVVTPRSEELKEAFDKAVRSNQNSISFTIFLYDKGGFELCKKEVKPTPFVDANDRLEELHANETFYSFECSRSTYLEADRWGLSYVFPSLIATSTEKTVQNSDAKKEPTVKPPTLSGKDLEGDDTITGFDVGDGHLETRSGNTFLVYRDGERYTALAWLASSPIHYTCKAKSDCLIENNSNNEAVHGRLIH